MTDLVSYVRDLERKGYSVQSIRQSLLSYGYPENVIDHAIYNVGNSTRTLKISPMLIILILIIGLASGTLYYFFFKSAPSGTSDTSIEITMNNVQAEVSPGDTLTGNLDITYDGKNSISGYLKYELFNTKGERLKLANENMALSETISKQIEFQLPKEIAPGTYTFSVKAIFGKASPKSTTNIKVSSGAIVPPTNNDAKPTCSDGKKNQNEEGIDCGGSCSPCKSCPSSCDDKNADTQDYCDQETFECKHDRIAKCGDGICSASETQASCPADCSGGDTGVWDQLEKIKNLAKTDPIKALAECNKIDADYRDKCLQDIGETTNDPKVCEKIEDSMQRDRCFSNVAKGLDNVEICENVVKDDRKDYCYINFMQNGDYSVCDKLTNKYLKKSCLTLKETTQ